MLNRNFSLGALLALSVSFLVAFSNAKSESNAVYEYVTIWQSDTRIHIVEQGKEPFEEYVKKERRGINASYEVINKFEAQGYELFESNMFATTSSTYNSFLLRRKKQ